MNRYECAAAEESEMQPKIKSYLTHLRNTTCSVFFPGLIAAHFLQKLFFTLLDLL